MLEVVDVQVPHQVEAHRRHIPHTVSDGVRHVQHVVLVHLPVSRRRGRRQVKRLKSSEVIVSCNPCDNARVSFHFALF